MKYTDLSIQTQREAPNNARTQGFAFLVCAGYHTRESQPAALGERAFKHVYNDADLIGCPVRVTVGERGLQSEMVELKLRISQENINVPINNPIETINLWKQEQEQQ